MHTNVNYARVVDALAGSIGELNRANRVAPASPAEPSFDVEGLLDELLRELDHNNGGSIADAAADAAAENSASSQEFFQLVPIFTALSTALAVYGVAKDAYSLYQMFRQRRRR